MELCRPLTAHRPVTINKTKPNLVNLLIFKRYFWWLGYFLIRCNSNNVYTSTQSFFEFRNGKLHPTFPSCATIFSPKGNNKLNFRLARDQVVHLATASRRQENNLFAVMAAKRFQTRTEEESRSNKSLNDWSLGKQLILFPSNLND